MRKKTGTGTEYLNGDDGFAQRGYLRRTKLRGVCSKRKIEQLKGNSGSHSSEITGTELFSLLENSVADASRKIAELLDSSLSTETEPGSSTLRKNDLGNFDIGEFL